MTVSEIMRAPAVTCTPETSLALAASLMRDADYGTLPVVDSRGRVAGIITDRDVCLAFASSNRNAHHIAVHEVMSKKPLTVFCTDTVQTALEKMKTWRVHRLPVVDALGHVRGILSVEDVVLRGLKGGGLVRAAIISALRTMHETRPIEVDADMVPSR